ncbi:carbonic anhydrase [Luedemannella helvata]|uniref:Carbonic anhydrase n=1 Tax=Luedemannella helvata TaxID=349315 RepID=A0ABP4X7Y1_9ACTN
MRSQGVTPQKALEVLLAGNDRFTSGAPRYGHEVSSEAARSVEQKPYAVVAGCIDSRVPLEAIFDQDFGSIAVVRSGAHVLDRALIGSIEFAVTELSVPLVLVLGHERCGAVASTVEAVRAGTRPPGALSYLIEVIAPSVTGAEAEVATGGAPLTEEELAARATRRHVLFTVAQLRALPVVATSRGEVAVAGAIYNLDSGEVELLTGP